jgi:hypothetical protein
MYQTQYGLAAGKAVGGAGLRDRVNSAWCCWLSDAVAALEGLGWDWDDELRGAQGDARIGKLLRLPGQGLNIQPGMIGRCLSGGGGVMS